MSSINSSSLNLYQEIAWHIAYLFSQNVVLSYPPTISLSTWNLFNILLKKLSYHTDCFNLHHSMIECCFALITSIRLKIINGWIFGGGGFGLSIGTNFFGVFLGFLTDHDWCFCYFSFSSSSFFFHSSSSFFNRSSSCFCSSTMFLIFVSPFIFSQP